MDQIVIKSDKRKTKPRRTAYDDEIDRRVKQIQEFRGEK